MTNSSSLLLVGCGNMGGALLARWKESYSNIHVIEPHGNFLPNLAALPADVSPSVVILAVKPQSLAEILPEYKARFGTKPLYVSIAAGKSISFFQNHLGSDAKIVRAMPNTPAMVGKGMTALCASANLLEADKKLAGALMDAVGKTAWIDEAQMDAVTALSGSGPAYVFLFLDALAKAGVGLGLSQEQAKILALQTVQGAGELAEKNSESFEQLRKNVTSPGGTTEAALGVLMKDGALEKLVENALKAAAERSKQLAN